LLANEHSVKVSKKSITLKSHHYKIINSFIVLPALHKIAADPLKTIVLAREMHLAAADTGYCATT
jgi:hypothetical protein